MSFSFLSLVPRRDIPVKSTSEIRRLSNPAAPVTPVIGSCLENLLDCAGHLAILVVDYREFMVVRREGLILLSVILSIFAVPSMVSAVGCFSGEVVYAREPATIRDAPYSSGAVVRKTATGEGLYIYNSRRSNANCWLQTSRGWLIYDPLVISDTFIGVNKEPSGAVQPSCLKGETAYTTGPMNIRESPTTRSPVVASAQAGDIFTVVQKTVGVEWCWLKVSRGWLASTGRVQATKPGNAVDTGATVPTTMPANIDNCCVVDRHCMTDQEWVDGYWAHQNGQCGARPQFSVARSSRPRIEGSEAFVYVINETLNLMERKTPALYQYILSVTSVIVEHGPDRCDWGLAYVGSGRTSLGSCLVEGQMPRPLYVVAAYLAHEACHHRGEDMISGVFDHEPCYKAGHDAFAATSA